MTIHVRHYDSQICMRLAAAGNIVVAIEHHDGTGQMVYTPETKESIQYLRESDVCFDVSNAKNMKLREEQLEFRRHEMYAIHRAFVDYVNSETPTKLKSITRDELPNRKTWHGKVNADKLYLVGHSFGACTNFSLLSEVPTTGYRKLDVSGIIALDPWIEPLPSPGPIPPPNHTFLPLLVMASEPFTLWEDHHGWLRKLMREWYGPTSVLLTFAASQHTDFSDYSARMPAFRMFGGKLARMLMQRIVSLCDAFLRGKLEDKLGELPMTKAEIQYIPGKLDKWGTPASRFIAEPGAIIRDEEPH